MKSTLIWTVLFMTFSVLAYGFSTRSHVLLAPMQVPVLKEANFDVEAHFAKSYDGEYSEVFKRHLQFEKYYAERELFLYREIQDLVLSGEDFDTNVLDGLRGDQDEIRYLYSQEQKRFNAFIQERGWSF